MRTQAEIRERFNSYDGDSDPFGFSREALLDCLEFDTVRDIVKPEITADDWHEVDPAKTAREYLVFAVGKAITHRGLSANRSIMKMSEYLWVLGEDTLLERFSLAPYAQYGAPQLKLLIDAWKITDEEITDEGFLRMAQGLPCKPDCMDGCER